MPYRRLAERFWDIHFSKTVLFSPWSVCSLLHPFTHYLFRHGFKPVVVSVSTRASPVWCKPIMYLFSHHSIIKLVKQFKHFLDTWVHKQTILMWRHRKIEENRDEKYSYLGSIWLTLQSRCYHHPHAMSTSSGHSPSLFLKDKTQYLSGATWIWICYAESSMFCHQRQLQRVSDTISGKQNFALEFTSLLHQTRYNPRIKWVHQQQEGSGFGRLHGRPNCMFFTCLMLVDVLNCYACAKR